MAFGRIWLHGKYSYGVCRWFAYTIWNFQKSSKIEKCQHFFSGWMRQTCAARRNSKGFCVWLSIAKSINKNTTFTIYCSWENGWELDSMENMSTKCGRDLRAIMKALNNDPKSRRVIKLFKCSDLDTNSRKNNFFQPELRVHSLALWHQVDRVEGVGGSGKA